ncbi:putative PurR-regulated permease PerM [Halohasta litchfieldiae]|jgi:predicted PurR-regulated permease PerM|uniref:Predicted PurR-regulated permease PerM n=1 Tax=Halohasta litchfieldiae TaxID=1073996 RepID=A0A1H6R8E4_9EURY|nr:AI-2E family transporter [Halohasta litchfieldiae]ATW89824.1 putative PurR-regulated permease PerM [Halohasta litchfieldiae]SEI52158.1 Predicted PurR-regulated permease PerM [Halohasta litchfieldiae]
MSIQSTLRQHPIWMLVGIALLGAVAYVVSSFIGTLVFGLFLYYSTRPVYNRIEGRVGNPSVAAGISIFALALPALALVTYALLIVFRQLNELTRTTALDPTDFGLDPAVFNRITDPAVLLSTDIREFLSAELVGSVLGSLTSAVETLSVFAIAIINLFAMVALAFYLLRDDHRISAWLLDAFGDKGTLFRRYLVAVDRDLKDIFFGNILNAVFAGTIAVITYSVLNVIAPPALPIPAAALVGLLAGVASLIPVVGMKLIYVPVGLYMTIQSITTAGTETLWFVVLFFLLSLVVVDSIPDLVLRPYVSGRNVHVGALMLAYTLGPLLFGWYGLFLMPVLLVLVVQFARIVLPDLLADEPSTPMELVGVPLRPSQPVEPAEDGSLPRSEQSTE